MPGGTQTGVDGLRISPAPWARLCRCIGGSGLAAGRDIAGADGNPNTSITSRGIVQRGGFR